MPRCVSGWPSTGALNGRPPVPTRPLEPDDGPALLRYLRSGAGGGVTPNPEGHYDLKNGQTKPMVGKLRLIEGIRPGVVTSSLGFGHWAYGSRDVVIDGKRIRGDARRGKGIHPNAAMRTDPVLANTCLSDPVGASAVFYDTTVKLVKA